MKLAFVLIVSLAALALASPPVRDRHARRARPQTPAGPPAGRCFVKRTRCCFRFSACGGVKRKIASKPRRCDFRKCIKRCRPVCRRVCGDRRVQEKKRICRNTYRRVWYKYRSAAGVTLRAHRWAPAGKRCRTFKVWVVKHECKSKCEKKCYTNCYKQRATCREVRTVRFPKFCAKLDCAKPTFVGNTKKPEDVVGRDGKVVKVRTVREKGWRGKKRSN